MVSIGEACSGGARYCNGSVDDSDALDADNIQIFLYYAQFPIIAHSWAILPDLKVVKNDF